MSKYLRFFFLICLLLIVIISSVRLAGSRGGPFSLSGFMMEVGASTQDIVTGSAMAVENFWRGYFYFINTAEENKKLHQTVSLLRSRLSSLQEAELANKRLNSLLKFKVARNLSVLGGRVVGSDPKAWFKTVVIEGGSADGVKRSMPVITNEGVVGKVVKLSPRYSQVLLMIDYNSSIDAIIQRNRVRGILSGRSKDLCTLKYVLKNDDVVRGDVLLTSGFGGVFPKGLVLGTVSRVRRIEHDLFLEIEVKPAVDFKKLEEVLVVLEEKKPF